MLLCLYIQRQSIHSQEHAYFRATSLQRQSIHSQEHAYFRATSLPDLYCSWENKMAKHFLLTPLMAWRKNKGAKETSEIGHGSHHGWHAFISMYEAHWRLNFSRNHHKPFQNMLPVMGQNNSKIMYSARCPDGSAGTYAASKTCLMILLLPLWHIWLFFLHIVLGI